MKKIILFVFSIYICLFSAFSLQVKENGSRLYQDALTYFDLKEYGKALSLSEEAVVQRKDFVQDEIKKLNDAIEPKEVQKVGTKISEIKKILEKREEWIALKIIENYMNRKGDDFFQNDINKMISYMESIKVFPEAQKLIGDIYKIEGEYSFAEYYYNEALKSSNVLDIPDQRYEILYLLAELCELQNDEDGREKRLLGILNEDNKYTDKSFVNAMLRTIRQDKEDSMEKFFKLYRAENYYMMNAYSLLADFYSDKGDKEKALGFYAIAVITGFTKVYSVVQKRNINFEYEGVSSVLFEASHYDDIVKWGTDNSIRNSSFNFTEACMKDEDYIFSNKMLKVLAEYCPEEYYRKAAVLMLDKLN